MQNEPGTLSLCGNGRLCLAIAEETYRLSRDDIHTLLFYGQSVPLARTKETANPDGAVVVTTVIDGHITVHASGRAVIAATRDGLFQHPVCLFPAGRPR